MPNAFEAILLALAAWRIWQLLADDTIFDRPRRYITVRSAALAEFIECPYCLGFWIALLWVIAFAIWPTETLWAALPFAVNAGVVAVHRWLSVP